MKLSTMLWCLASMYKCVPSFNSINTRYTASCRALCQMQKHDMSNTITMDAFSYQANSRGAEWGPEQTVKCNKINSFAASS
jgi:hypothetical protein